MRLANNIPTCTGLQAAVLVSLLASLLIGAEPEAVRIASQPGACQLSVEGRAIERLTLADASGRITPIERPAGSVSLPAGKYRIQQVELKGGFHCYVFGGSEDDWIHVAPNKSPVLKAGAPLTPKVRIKRVGRLLKLDYDLADAAGRNYVQSGTNRADPPKFTVYKDGQSIGSGSFEYG